MRKSTKLLKRFAALFLVVLLSCESFAAVVSDNDGAAFITKAEFDSLKNSFQAQIDDYNANVDSKIENAINGYIAGVKSAKTTKLNVLYPKKDSSYQNIKWTSKTDYSYDTASNKYWHYYCEFQMASNDYWSIFKYEYGSDRSYNTLLYNAGNKTYQKKKIQFDLNCWLYFARLKAQWTSGTAGHVLWSQFWPTTLTDQSRYLGQRDGGKDSSGDPHWGYTCMYYPNVNIQDVTESYYVIAPVSNSTTYTFVQGKELKGDDGTVTSGDTNYTRVKDVWKAASITGFDLYKNMTVNTVSNVGKTTKSIAFDWMKENDKFDTSMSNGLLLARCNEIGKLKLSFTASHAGQVRIGLGKVSGSSININYTNFSVTAGANSLTKTGVTDGTYIYIIYLPTSTTVLGYLDNFIAQLESET